MQQNSCNNMYSNNIGFSSRLPYDPITYEEKIIDSTSPLLYRLNTDSIYNCSSCLSTLGPRSRYGVSMPPETNVATSQSPDIVNIESILTNRNVKTSKSKKDKVNPIDVTKFPLKDVKICNNSLNPISTRLTPNTREIGLNRFYDLNKNPQLNIFEPYAINTRNQAIDNYIVDIPQIWNQYNTIPHEKSNKSNKSCCKNIEICPIE